MFPTFAAEETQQKRMWKDFKRQSKMVYTKKIRLKQNSVSEHIYSETVAPCPESAHVWA